MADTEDTRYTFALIVHVGASNGGSRVYYGPGKYDREVWCRTARGAWDYVKFACPVMGGEALAVYRDGVKLGEYGRPNHSDRVKEWDHTQGWITPRVLRTS